MTKIAVYTANFSDYDVLVEPAVVNPSVDYLYFTDSSTIQSSVWRIMHVKQPCPTPQHSSRYYFDQSHIVASDYDITIMHGANSQLLIDPVDLVDKYLPSHIDMALFKHPHRSRVFHEFNAVIKMGKDTRENVMPQWKRYFDDGFRDNIGLSACILLIRRNTPAIAQFEALWWNEVQSGSHRDQLSFDYVRWKTGLPITRIPGDCFASDIIRVGAHTCKK